MTAALPTEEQADRVARELAPDVVRIRFRIDKDWVEDPAIFFLVVLSDDASRSERLGEVADRAETIIRDRLHLDELGHISYFNFRSASEHAQLEDAPWP